VAQLDEVARQDVLEEPAQEFVMGQGDQFAMATHEADVPVIDGAQAVVAQPDPVGVATEVGVDLLCAAEGRLGVDDPVDAVQLVDQRVEGRGQGQVVCPNLQWNDTTWRSAARDPRRYRDHEPWEPALGGSR